MKCLQEFASEGPKGPGSNFMISINENLKPQQDVTLTITRKDGSKQNVTLLLRIDTPIEVDYYKNGGILPFVLKELVSKA